MNTRRKFLLKGSLATTAFFASKPFQTIADAIAPVTGYSVNNNKVVFAHTGNHFGTALHPTLKNIAALKRDTDNLVLVHAGKTTENHASFQGFDMMMAPDNPVSFNSNEYKIIYKGNIKIGIITTGTAEPEMIDRVNIISSWLKKEKNCHIVACLSQLGYKQKDTMDDFTLAEKSAHLDIIIGGHAKNYCQHPVIVQNKNKEEVIINHAAGNDLAMRKIEIEFSESGKKRHIAFTRSVPLNNSSISS